MLKIIPMLAVFTLFAAFPAFAANSTVTIHRIDANGIGEVIGSVKITETAKGILLAPKLKGLTAGAHGFHIHEKPDCGAGIKDGKPVAGLAAGGHYDPSSTKKHAGPAGRGHLGDLPVLVVSADGSATQPVTVGRLKLGDVRNRSLMIHEGGDNYSDDPKPLGGGGGRVACGVIR